MAESSNVRLARLEEKFDSMAKDIKGMKKLLEGNGNPGFIEEVETRFKSIEIKQAEHIGGKKMLGAILGSSFFTGALVFIAGKLVG